MTEMLIILALILVNGVFAMSEIAVISSRKLRLKSMARRGSRGARAALALTESPTRFLSTIQIGITLVGIIAGAGTMAYQFSYAEQAPQVEMNHKAVPLFNNPPAAPMTNVVTNAPNFASIVMAYGSAVVHINV